MEETIQTHNWTGTLAPNQFATITLLNTAFNGIFNVSIDTANGATDQRTTNNTTSASFMIPINSLIILILLCLRLQQDLWGSETTWDLKDGSGVVNI